MNYLLFYYYYYSAEIWLSFYFKQKNGKKNQLKLNIAKQNWRWYVWDESFIYKKKVKDICALHL